MIPIVGAIKAWTVIWNLALIGITGGAWLGVLIVWAFFDETNEISNIILKVWQDIDDANGTWL